MKRLYLLILFFSLNLIFISTARAAIITVCSSGCNSTTIQGGINQASNWDEVRIIEANDYNESVVINRSIILTSNTSSRPMIFQETPTVTGDAIVDIQSGNSTISNIYIKYNGSNNGTNPFVSEISSSFLKNSTIKNVSMEGNGFTYGLSLLDSDTILISLNLALNNSLGFSISSSNNTRILNNSLVNNTVAISLVGSNLTISNNNITETHNSALLQQGLLISSQDLPEFANDITETNLINGLPVLYLDGTFRSCPDNQTYSNGSSYSFMGFVGCKNITVRDSSPTDGILFGYVNNSKISNVSISYSIYPLLLTGSNNINLTKVTTSNDYIGQMLSLTTNSTFTQNVANNNTYYGFWLIYSQNNTFDNNTANNNTLAGFSDIPGSFFTSSGNTFSNNIVSNNALDGIEVLIGSGETLINNQLNNNGIGLYLYISTNNTLANNSISASHTSSSSQQGLFVEGGLFVFLTNNISEDNLINGLPVLYLDGTFRSCPDNQTYSNGSSYSFMGFVGCKNITVKDSSPSDHLMFASTYNSTISNISISYSRIAFSFFGSLSDIISKNTAKSGKTNPVTNLIPGLIIPHSVGFYISDTENDTFTNNSAINNSMGFSLVGSEFNTLTNNSAINNSYGFNLDSSFYETFLSDISNQNSVSGISLTDFSDFNIFKNIVENENENVSIYIESSDSNNFTFINTSSSIPSSIGFFISSSNGNRLFDSLIGTASDDIRLDGSSSLDSN